MKSFTSFSQIWFLWKMFGEQKNCQAMNISITFIYSFYIRRVFTKYKKIYKKRKAVRINRIRVAMPKYLSAYLQLMRSCWALSFPLFHIFVFISICAQAQHTCMQIVSEINRTIVDIFIDHIFSNVSVYIVSGGGLMVSA